MRSRGLEPPPSKPRLGPQPSASAIPPRPQFNLCSQTKKEMVCHEGLEPSTL